MEGQGQKGSEEVASETLKFVKQRRFVSLYVTLNLTQMTLIGWCIIKPELIIYHYNPKYWDREVLANSVNQDQTLLNVAFDQGLHYLPYIQQYFRFINR